MNVINSKQGKERTAYIQGSGRDDFDQIYFAFLSALFHSLSEQI